MCVIGMKKKRNAGKDVCYIVIWKVELSLRTEVCGRTVMETEVCLGHVRGIKLGGALFVWYEACFGGGNAYLMIQGLRKLGLGRKVLGDRR